MGFGGFVGDLVEGGFNAITGMDAKQAAKQQQKYGERAIDEQRRQFDVTQENLRPYRSVGTPALGALASLMGITPDTSSIDAEIAQLEEQLAGMGQAQPPTQTMQSRLRREGGTLLTPHDAGYFEAQSDGGFLGGPLREAFDAANGREGSTELERRLAELRAERDTLTQGYDFQESPGYQFRFDEGQRAARNQLAASGNRLSGRALKELTRYGQGMASQEFGNQYNRLAALAGTGQTAVNSANQYGTQTANSIADLYTQIGNARASGIVGQANNIRQNARDISEGIGNFVGLGGLS